MAHAKIKFPDDINLNIRQNLLNISRFRQVFRKKFDSRKDKSQDVDTEQRQTMD